MGNLLAIKRFSSGNSVYSLRFFTGVPVCCTADHKKLHPSPALIVIVSSEGTEVFPPPPPPGELRVVFAPTNVEHR